MIVSTRRGILGTAAALAAAPPGMPDNVVLPPVADHHADAELVAVCARFDAIERHINSHYSGGSRKIEDDEERDAVLAPFQEAQAPLLEHIVELRATTLDGFLARARTLALWDAQAIRQIGPENYLNERLLAALLRDMAGEVRS